jgi:hypothetical protein
MLSDSYHEWLRQPETQSLIKDITQSITLTMEEWANGDYTSDTMEGTVQRNARALGGVQTLQSLLENIQGGNYSA